MLVVLKKWEPAGPGGVWYYGATVSRSDSWVLIGG